MALLEMLTVNLGAAFAKAVVKLWLKDSPIGEAFGDGVIETFKKRFDDFETRRDAERVFLDLQDIACIRARGAYERTGPIGRPDLRVAHRVSCGPGRIQPLTTTMSR